MQNFDQFFNKVNGEMYKDVPPPVHYQLADYGISPSSYHLKPLTDEDMARYGAEDVANHYSDLHQGKNPTRIGDPMSDSDFKKFFGHTW